MNLSTEERERLLEAHAAGGVDAVATTVMELVAARGGTITAEEIVELATPQEGYHLSAATLQAKVAEQDAEIARLKALVERREKMWAEARLESSQLRSTVREQADELAFVRSDKAALDHAASALRAEVERLKAENVTQHNHRKLFRDRAVAAESRLAAIRDALDAIRDGRRFRGEYRPEAIARGVGCRLRARRRGHARGVPHHRLGVGPRTGLHRRERDAR